MTPPAVEDVFLAALDRAAPADRAAFVEAACAGDPDRLARVRELLAAHDQSRGPLDAPPVAGPTADLPPGPARPGQVVGPYRLVEPIGEGGMGTVFLARQQEPVQRLVAVKVIKAGMDSEQVLARFEAERQALALMDHPNIAKVFDAGATPEGRPYFVMELVKGVSITRYCDDHHLTPRQRLELFVPVCQAVQHAHQKGVIHRDIKPSNVLVAEYDGRPVPKVIDFGVAKALGVPLTEKTLVTGLGAVVGTPEYMSPEQAELNNVDIDTRSDVYSLGVLLYELLTGSTPLTKRRAKEAALLEVLRVIREEEPPRPSAKLSTADGLPGLAASRGTEPAKLTRLVRGELDWIVMKALEKDRSRRYETANGFSADVQRYLADEAVQACPPSVGYRLRKFVRRNKGPVLAASLVFLTALVGAGLATWQAVLATRERDEKEKARLAEARQRQRADEERANAVASEADTRAFSTFLVQDVLETARPKNEPGGLGIDVTVKRALEVAASKIGARFRDNPRAEAIARHDLGVTFRMMGELDKSEEQLRRAYELRTKTLGADHEDTLMSGNSLGVVYAHQGRFAEGEPLLVQLLEAYRRTLGDEHQRTLTAMNNLAGVYWTERQFDKAEPLFVKTLEVRRRVLGEEHPHTFLSMNFLAKLYTAQNKLAKAEPLYEESLEIQRRTRGEGNPLTIDAMINLAGLYRAQRQLLKAEPLCIKALEISRRALGETYPNTLDAMNALAGVYTAQGQYPKAEALLTKVLEGRRRVLGEEHAQSLDAMNALARVYAAQARYAEAESLYREVLTKTRKRRAGASPPLADALAALGRSLLQQKKYADADPLLREGLMIRQQRLPDDWCTFSLTSQLGGSLLGRLQYADAEPLLVAGYGGMKQREAQIPADDTQYQTEALERLVQLYDGWGKKAQADEWRKRLDVHKKGIEELEHRSQGSEKKPN